MPARLGRVRQQLATRELDALLVSQPENRRYLSGFTGSAGYLLISASQAVLLSDFRYMTQAPQQAPDFEFVRLDRDFPRKTLPELAARLGVQRLGFEAADVSVALHQRFAAALGDAGWRGDLVAVEGLVEELRAVKDDAELAIIAEAVRIVDDAFASLVGTIKPGQSEREVAWTLEKLIRDEGAEGLSFATIIASGPNAAKPHHGLSDREIQKGEPIVCDFGARFEGYCSDITRTICIGPGDGRFDEIYGLVLRAQLEAEQRIGPGIEARIADQYARDIISAAGYGDQFGHGLGHGVGLEVHEVPFVNTHGATELAPAMAVTVEPGIYLPDWGGVRIEDIGFVRQQGLEIINRASKTPNI